MSLNDSRCTRSIRPAASSPSKCAPSSTTWPTNFLSIQGCPCMNFSFANAPHGLSAVPVSGAFLAEIYVKPVIGTDNSAEVQSRDEDSTRLHLTAGIKRRDYCARKQRHAHVCSEASNDPP